MAQNIRNMAEFSQLTGISRPTIAKYFDDPESVRPSIRQQIEAALERTDYRPNLFAVNMKKKRPKLLGVIVPDTGDTFFTELVRRIELRCIELGYLALVLSSHGDEKTEAKSLQTFMSLPIAGAIAAPLGERSDLNLFRRLRAKMPIVFLDSRLDVDAPFVGTDNGQTISTITEYLYRTGSPPTYFDMPAVNHNATERRQAYVRVMRALGLTPEIVDIGPNNWRFEDIAFDRTLALLDGSGFPTQTILCANDRCAVGVMAAAFQRGRRVGRGENCDLRVAGHDDQPSSRFGCPPLTTVAQDFDLLARLSVDQLLDEVALDRKDPDPAHPPGTWLPGKLVMRGSA
ncbi:LacI family DNA-binding transcriptional regulator [Paraburkholderia caffeinilytica]|uniref:LacI family DNA-binding transcriptional regulator n=1 Tax=Paraburkholderia caffeinilytica TaxID=1761016 RepID=UPI003DA1836E